MFKKSGPILLIAALLLVFWLGKPSAKHDNTPAPVSAETQQPDTQALPAPASSPQSNLATGSAELPTFLPPEAKKTLDLIARGGPFPNRQDGVVFQNRERRLPNNARGYYHEYTVETPGINHRAARRIITGGAPIEIYYYTDDHYNSFRQFEVRQ